MNTLVLDLVKNHKEKRATKDGNFVIHAYRDVLMMGDARNFNKRGENCKITYFKGEWWELKEILEKDYPKITLQQLFDGEVVVDVLDIRNTDNKNPKLFTECKLGNFGKMTSKGIKKLKEISEHIDKTTLLKLLASGKATSIAQEFVFTDDYALDCERDFCKNEKRSVKDIVEDVLSFSGFHCYVSSYDESKQQGTLAFSVHPNNSVNIYYSLAA